MISGSSTPTAKGIPLPSAQNRRTAAVTSTAASPDADGLMSMASRHSRSLTALLHMASRAGGARGMIRRPRASSSYTDSSRPVTAGHENRRSASVPPRLSHCGRAAPESESTSPTPPRALPRRPAGTSQPVTPASTLSGSPPARVATTARRCAMASSVTRELPSYSVGWTNTVAASYHACSVACLNPPGHRHARADAERGTQALERRPVRPVSDEHPAPGQMGHLRQRAGQDVEALVLLEAADAEQHRLVAGMPSSTRVLRPSSGPARRSHSSRSTAFGTRRTRSAGTCRCSRTIGSSERSVARTRSAACAHVLTAFWSGR